jgi:hypothetical protein
MTRRETADASRSVLSPALRLEPSALTSPEHSIQLFFSGVSPPELKQYASNFGPHCYKCREGYGTLCDGRVAVTPDQALDMDFDRNVPHDFIRDPQSRFKVWGGNTTAVQEAGLQSSHDFR